LQAELLESRLVPATTGPLTIGVIGDFGVASSILNLGSVLVGSPDGEGDVAKLVHGWNPDFITTMGDNNYLAGEQFDTNFALDLQLAISLGKLSSDDVRTFLSALDNLPVPGLTDTTGNTTNNSATVTAIPVPRDSLAVGMIVYDTSSSSPPNLPFPTGPSMPFFATITGISGTDNNVTITLSAPANATKTGAAITILPPDISLQTLDGLSHIDRNIGRYYSDFIYPYVASTPPTPPTAYFGNGSPTGTNRFFPTPGNHDWADPFSDGGASSSDLTLSLPSLAREKVGTLTGGAGNATITANDVSSLTVGMSVLGTGLPPIVPKSGQFDFELSIINLARIQSIATNAPSVSFTGNTTQGQPTITNVSSKAGLFVGMAVTGAGIPNGTTIADLNTGPTSITLSQPATATATNVSLSAANYTITLTTTGVSNGVPNATFVFLPIFTAPTGIAFAPGTLDPYLNYFAGLNPGNSPGFQIGTTRINGTAVSLTSPYYYSYTAGTTSTGRPLIEFFSVDSEPADPNLLLNSSFYFTGSTTANSNQITGVSAAFINHILAAGMEVSGPGIPAGSTITSLNAAGGAITLDQKATATAASVNLSLRPAVQFTATINPDGVTVTSSFPNQLYGGIYAYAVGMEVTGPGIQTGTKISAVNPSGNSLTLSLPATPASGVTLSELTAYNVANSNEGVWLKNSLASSHAVWKLPYFHHTPYSSSSEPDEGPNGEWMRLPYQQWGASAVLYGHVHNYERLSEKDPAIPGVSQAGTVAIPYIVNGSGGAPITPFLGELDPGSQLRYSGAFGAMKMVVDQRSLNLKFINVYGAVIDDLTLTAPPPPAQTSTPGVFDPSTATWYLRNENDSGAPDVGQFQYGGPGWLPVTGDWNGDGLTTIGVVDPSTMTWYLRNENSAGAPDAGKFQYGAPGWVPVTGDWNGDGRTDIGVFDPQTAIWYLRNEISAGAPDAGTFQYGGPGWLPVTGDWTGQGKTTIGVVDPQFNWYLRNSNTSGAPDFPVFQYGGAGWTPVTGDWTGQGKTTIGVVDPGRNWYLRNSNSAGAPDLPVFQYGGVGWGAVTGAWDSPVFPQQAANGAATTFDGPPLTTDQLQTAVQGALGRLAGAGIRPELLARLGAVTFTLGLLPAGDLGLSNVRTGSVVISPDAAGHGWFVDPTPLQDEEFTGTSTMLARPGTAAAGRMDLLSVVLHELGHFNGWTELDPASHPDDLMALTLATGVRRTQALDAVFVWDGWSYRGDVP
jgi:hypothetical protein